MHRNWLPTTLLILVSTASSAIISKPVPDTALAGAETIGVVSALGNTFHGVHVANTVFGNKRYTAEVPEWRIDEFVTAQVLLMLSQRGRLPGARLPVETASNIEALYRDKKIEVLDSKKVLDLARAQGWTLVLVLHRAHYNEAPFHVGGYGVFSRDSLGAKSHCGYTLFLASVYRVDTGKNVGHRWAPPCFGRDSDWLPKSAFDEYSAEAKAQIETEIKMALPQTLAWVLEDLKLAVPTVPTR